MTKKIILFLFFCLSEAYGQTNNAIEDLQMGAIENVSLSSAKIEKISFSKRVYILDSAEQTLVSGDYISVLQEGNLIFRALVAKNANGKVGAKVTKIYSIPLWNSLAVGTGIQFLKGDDSYYRKNGEGGKDGDLSSSEDLLKQEQSIEDDLTNEAADDRKIKTDNMISLNYYLVDGFNTDSSRQSYGQINGFWSYQFYKNFWLEAGYGQNVISSYPAEDLDTKLSHFTARLKYTISAPLDFYLQPYIGFLYATANSPNAGEPAEELSADPQVKAKQEHALEAEIAAVEDLERRDVIFGITLLKRLVPGWFFRADLGTDAYGGGITLEF